MRLLILGTGSMANQHARNFSAIKGVSVVCGVDIVPDRLATYCTEHKIGRSFPSLEEALEWGEFDAVANVGVADVAAFAPLLTSENETTRRRAAEIVGVLPEVPGDAVPTLAHALSDESPRTVLEKRAWK